MTDLMDKILVLNKELVNWRQIDREVVFLHNKEKCFYELNKTATYIWLGVNGKRSVREIVEGLISNFSVSEAKARNETVAFIQAAIKNQIFILDK